MNEGSLPPFAALALRSFPGVIRRVFSRLFGRARRRSREDAALRSQAASVIREYTDAHITLFERAQRLEEKAERLEKAGTPSESARNRADRARREVEAGLDALRASFAASVGGSEGRRAFDREAKIRYPAFELSDESP
jgi:hypothetical protein